MLIPWLPALFLIPNEIYYNTATFGEQFSSAKLMKITLNSVFFPAWPIYNYMTSFRSLTISDYLSRLDKINSIKQIMHSSLHMVLTIFLIMRGRLLQEDETSCVKDNLGRSVCFKYIVILSLILSTILIIGKVIKEENYSFIKIPFISCTLVFRTVSFAFILTYIDWWSVISLLILFITVILLMKLFENEQARRGANHKDKENDFLPSKGEKDKANISSCIKACLYILLPFIFDKSILVFIVINSLILINTFVIFVLVMFIKQFNYEKNVVDDNLFIVIVLNIVCFGVVSSILRMFVPKTWSHFCKYGNAVISILFLLIFPLIVVLSIIFFSKNVIYLYTIQSENNLTKIEAFPFHISSTHDVSKLNSEYHDISWIANNVNNSQAEMLCFLFDHSKHCLDKEYLSIVLEKESFDANIKKIQLSANKSENVYISNIKPTLSDITKVLECSKSIDIFVNNPRDREEDDFQCQQFKFLNFDNEIVERKCITFGFTNLIQKVDVKCENEQNLNNFIYFHGNEALEKKLLKFISGVKKLTCCANNTHFAEIIGKCSKFSYNYLKQFNNLRPRYRTPDCPNFNYRKYSMFLKLSQKCVIILSVHAKCKETFEAVNCDLNHYSCNNTIIE